MLSGHFQLIAVVELVALGLLAASVSTDLVKNIIPHVVGNERLKVQTLYAATYRKSRTASFCNSQWCTDQH